MKPALSKQKLLRQSAVKIDRKTRAELESLSRFTPYR